MSRLGVPTIALMLLATNGTAHAQPTCTVEGEVFYLQRIAMPPEAEVEVRLEDTALADAKAIPIGGQTYTMGGKQVPFRFSFEVDCERLRKAAKPTLYAAIKVGAELRFINKTVQPFMAGTQHRIRLDGVR